MKNNLIRKCISGLAVGMVMMSFSAVAFAASESINGGLAEWYGGIDDDSNKIYSKVWDLKNDGIRYNVTVWVQDDNGDKSTKVGTTSGVKAAGEVKVTKTATYDHWLTTNKCGYKNVNIIS